MAKNKNKSKHTDKQGVALAPKQLVENYQDKNQDAKVLIKDVAWRFLGVVLMIVTTAAYIQSLPLIFIFVSAYAGLSPDVALQLTDIAVWFLASVGILVPLMYGFIAWMKFAWVRLVLRRKRGE